MKDLEASIEYYLETYNQNPKPFRWHKKADEILGSVARAAKALGNPKPFRWHKKADEILGSVARAAKALGK
ncbi:hypothetical protein AO286_26660 [Pseudomonas syringae]|uniref:hypothetical protein n=1 Tax=Pseudomonas syringae TaxID=317 RepID=UPI000C0B7618|nr:hypothetical protein AO286_26660 [Pseudomonas syringae]